jgi:pimeloyl-ACP methyl ester carboxylesterase
MRRRVASQDWLDASESMRGTFRLVIGEDLAPKLPDVGSSTILIWGDEDHDTPVWMGRRMEQEIPDAALVILRGGHYVYGERAAEFNRIAEHFLLRAS